MFEVSLRAIPVNVEGLSVCAPYQGYMVILKELNSVRWLPIFIGKPEAESISLMLENIRHSRPLTYDLFSNLLIESGTVVERVTVTDLKESTFYAEVVIRTLEGRRTVDARPSDAIALALKTEAPIFVNDTVLDLAGMKDDLISETSLNRHEAKLKKLNDLLAKAVEGEEYESAAKIRDKIQALQEKS